MAANLKSISKPTTATEAAVAPAPRVVRAGTEGSAGPFDATRGASRLLAVGRIDPIERPTGALESVIGIDERTRIVDTELAPWRMICALRLHAPAGTFIGTGWFVGPKTLVTAGHCVYGAQMGGWVNQIEVSPGRDDGHLPFGTVTATRFSTVDVWHNDENPDFDIGAIHLDQPLGEQVGWFAVGSVPGSELQGYGVNVSGYPGDRGAGRQQWFHRNRVLHVGERRVFYDIDTYGGQSGAPAFIYESEGSDPLVIGIHAYGIGGTPSHLGITANSAPRIIPEVLEQIEAWVAQDG